MSLHWIPCRKRSLFKLLLSVCVFAAFVCMVYDGRLPPNSSSSVWRNKRILAPNVGKDPSAIHKLKPAYKPLIEDALDTDKHDNGQEEEEEEDDGNYDEPQQNVRANNNRYHRPYNVMNDQKRNWRDEGVYEDHYRDEEIQISDALRDELWPKRTTIKVPPRKEQVSHSKLQTNAPSSTNRIYVDSIGQLGSQLFEYASFYGISQKTNKTPFLSYRSILPALFKNVTASRGYDPKVRIYIEDGAGVYTPSLFQHRHGDMAVCCYMQSWRYFYLHVEDLKAQLQFNDEIVRSAHRVIKEQLKQFLIELHKQEAVLEAAADPLLDDLPVRRKRVRDYLHTNKHIPATAVLNGTDYHFTWVGVHVHRLGYSGKTRRLQGFHAAPADYIHHAMDYYRARHNDTLFFVVSDDVHWCQQNVSNARGDVVYVGYNAASVDLAILSQMHHTVMTTGAFGWWGGWLAGGDVVYYPDWIQQDKETGRAYKLKDHYPPWWMSISVK